MENGKAKPMIFGYIHRGRAAAKYLRQLLPGAKQIFWQSPVDALPTHVIESQTSKAATAIREELKRLMLKKEHSISVKALKVRLGLGALSGRVFSDAVKAVLKGSEWQRRGKGGRTLAYMWA